MTLNYKSLFVLCTLSVLATVLFVGQFYDHHGDRTLFIKHRPSFRQMFSLPLKENNQLVNANIEDQSGEAVNKEFVLKSNLEESHGNIVIPSVLIQTCIMLLISTFYSFYKKTSIYFWQLIPQFFFNIIITSFGIFYMLWDDNSLTSIIWFGIFIIANYLTLTFLHKFFPSHVSCLA